MPLPEEDAPISEPKPIPSKLPPTEEEIARAIEVLSSIPSTRK